MPATIRPKSSLLPLAARTAGILAGGLALTAGTYLLRNTTYARVDRARAERAGLTLRTTMINGHRIRFAEGPDSGPALVLLPGQVSDLWNYARVMCDLSRDFHVYAVDVPGHGGSEHDPELYSGAVLGELFADFIAGVVGEQAIVSGHSSGGLIAAWIAASRPEVVAALVLEDPPFFSSALPESEKTANHVDLATTAHAFLTEHGSALDAADPPAGDPFAADPPAGDPFATEPPAGDPFAAEPRAGDPRGADFVAFYAAHTPMLDMFGDLGPRMRARARAQRAADPQRSVRWALMPPVLNEYFRGMGDYDPRFGQAFFDGSFHDHFDHALTLAAISAPTLLIHCNWFHDEDGVLMAAMSGEDAERARELIPDVRFERVDSGHAFHFEHPRRYARLLREFAADTLDEVDLVD